MRCTSAQSRSTHGVLEPDLQHDLIWIVRRWRQLGSATTGVKRPSLKLERTTGTSCIVTYSRPGEADGPIPQPCNDYLDSAGLDHPFQSVIAILAHLLAGPESLNSGRHARCGCRVFGERGRDGGALPETVIPARQHIVARWSHAIQYGSVQQRCNGRIGPAKCGAAEPWRFANPPGQPALKHCGLPRCLGTQRFGERTAGATERRHLAETPGHGFIVGVAHLFCHARVSAAAGSRGSRGGSGQHSSMYSRMMDESKLRTFPSTSSGTSARGLSTANGPSVRPVPRFSGHSRSKATAFSRKAILIF